jgi:DNA adenine methylase
VSRTNSPLRYPGGKSCLYDLLSHILRLNNLERGNYIEPYAGGCGLALSLLYGGHVADIHINDIDPTIWAFWHCVLNETDALAEKIAKTPVTVDEWRKQQKIIRKKDTTNFISLGFSTFFLNRTNRSGVIESGGVIGGLAQTGNYKIDCRYNKEDLIRRIRRIRKYKDRIHLTNMDAVNFIQYCKSVLPKSSFFCIDPPYYEKGSKLYTSFYKPDDHANLAELVVKLDAPWIVNYDDTPEIRHLYRQRRQHCFDINYSLQTKRIGTELLISSTGLKLPLILTERQIITPQYNVA